MSLDSLLWGLLAFVLYPLWLLSGVADALCHRRTDLPHTSGLGESAWHLVLLAQMGLAVLMVVLLDLNAAVLLALAILLVAHTLSAYADTRYTDGRRRIAPFEQHVHAWLEMLPVMAFALIVVLHWNEVAPEAGQVRDWTLRWRDPAWPLPWRAGFLAVSAAVGVTPFLLEFRQAWRAHRGLRRAGRAARGSSAPD